MSRGNRSFALSDRGHALSVAGSPSVARLYSIFAPRRLRGAWGWARRAKEWKRTDGDGRGCVSKVVADRSRQVRPNDGR